ncbi:MAG: hypothetical protein K1X79_09300 [Oligoflexia bacterium]|nr:hypothetical protein [Oligoflexia bacterium]
MRTHDDRGQASDHTVDYTAQVLDRALFPRMVLPCLAGLGFGRHYPTPNLVLEAPLFSPREIRSQLLSNSSEAIQLPYPSFERLPFREFVTALSKGYVYCRAEGEPATVAQGLETYLASTAIAQNYPEQAYLYARACETLVYLAAAVSGSPKLRITLKNTFLPTDAVWHLDRLTKTETGRLFPERSQGIRLVFAVGRDFGTNYTTLENFRLDRWLGFVWKHRHEIVKFYRRLKSEGVQACSEFTENPLMRFVLEQQDKLFLRAPSRIVRLPGNSIGIHRLGLPIDRRIGTVHRVDSGNQAKPGLQLYITVPLLA